MVMVPDSITSKPILTMAELLRCPLACMVSVRKRRATFNGMSSAPACRRGVKASDFRKVVAPLRRAE